MTKEDKKTVRVFGIASFLNDFGSDMIYPIWPLFVTTFLGANMTVLGFIDGLGDALVSISQGVSGYLSDRFRKRKIFIWMGYMFGSASRVGYALSRTWHWLVPFRILDRAGKMRGAPRDAMVADASTRENRGRNFGFLRTMDHLGAVCGIITTMVLFKYLGYKKLFLLAAIPSLIGSLLIILLIRDRKTENVHKGITLKNLSRNFKLYLLLSAIFALGSFSYSFLLIYAKEIGFNVTTVPILYLIFTLVASLMSLPFGRLADRIGRKIVLMFSYLTFATMCLGFVFVKSVIVLPLLFVLYGLHRASIEPVQKAFVSELAPRMYRATTLGTFQMIVGLFALPASLVAGLLWDNIGLHAPFMLSFGLSVVAVILMLFVRES